MKATITYLGDTEGYVDQYDELQLDEKKVMTWGAPGGPIKVDFPKDKPVTLDTDKAKNSSEKALFENIIKRAAVSRFFKVDMDAAHKV